MHNHSRRLNDHDHLLSKDRADIDMLHEILKESKKQTEEYQKQTKILMEVAPAVNNLSVWAEKSYDVIKPLATVSVIIIKIGGGLAILWAGLTALWHGAKALALKFGLLG